jgi:hypothetical protein
MSFSYYSRFDLHVCFDDPGSDNVIAFDIYFSWKVREFDNRWRDELAIKCTGWLTEVGDDCEFCQFPLRYAPRSKKFYLGPDKKRFPFQTIGNGGNICWNVINLQREVRPHVLNYLRRQCRFDVDEWDTEFRETLWESRRSLDDLALTKYSGRFVRTWLKDQAAQAGCTVADLLTHR